MVALQRMVMVIQKLASKRLPLLTVLIIILKWNGLTSAGDATVGKDVTINLRLEFAQAKS